MEAYLRLNPPARSQYRSPRRSRPTGLIVVHTAESVMDKVGPDTGAEGVARFIRSRDTPGSYHDIADRDSSIKLVRYSDEAFQDGTGSNPFALSISFALAAADWPKMTDAQIAGFLAQGAKAFARQQAWLRSAGYPTTPLRKLNRTQSENGMAGFISHRDRDPSRRSDPGVSFPWAAWFHACQIAISGPAPKPPPAPTPTPTPPEEDPVQIFVVTDERDPAFKPQYLTDMISKRWIRSAAELNEIADRLDDRLERVKLSAATLDSIPTVGEVPHK